MQKFNDTSLNSNPPLKISSIINPKKQISNRMVEYDISTTTVSNDVMQYHTFSVDESGYYSISNQLALKCNTKEDIHYLQMGICKQEYDDYGKLFNSFIFNSPCEASHVISNNLASFKKSILNMCFGAV